MRKKKRKYNLERSIPYFLCSFLDEKPVESTSPRWRNCWPSYNDFKESGTYIYFAGKYLEKVFRVFNTGWVAMIF